MKFTCWKGGRHGSCHHDRMIVFSSALPSWVSFFGPYTLIHPCSFIFKHQTVTSGWYSWLRALRCNSFPVGWADVFFCYFNDVSWGGKLVFTIERNWWLESMYLDSWLFLFSLVPIGDVHPCWHVVIVAMSWDSYQSFYDILVKGYFMTFLSFDFLTVHSKKVYRDLDQVDKCGFLHGVQHVSNNIFEVFLDIANFWPFLLHFMGILEKKIFEVFSNGTKFIPPDRTGIWDVKNHTFSHCLCTLSE